MAVLRAGERPSLSFWLAAGVGLIAVLAFAVIQGVGGRPQGADLLILIAVALGALGYAEGGALSREIGGGRVISWALVLSLPATAPVTAALVIWHGGVTGTPAAWAGFGYVAVISMFLGFFAWYRGGQRGDS
jgi:drug/metabolite transporter (DMT)-like permease